MYALGRQGFSNLFPLGIVGVLVNTESLMGNEQSKTESVFCIYRLYFDQIVCHSHFRVFLLASL